MNGTYSYRDSIIGYSCFGKGKQLLIAFHGYGQQSQDFLFLDEYLNTCCTVLAIDLPAHGQTVWNELKSPNANDLVSIIESICAKENIESTSRSLVSFSIGSLVAQSIFCYKPDLFERVILIAPPSDNFRRLMRFSLHTKFGNYLMEYSLRHYQFLNKLSHRLHAVGILSTPVHRFGQLFITQHHTLEKVFIRWKLLSNFLLPMKLFVKQMNHSGKEVILISGKGDKITPPDSVANQVRKIKRHSVQLLPQYHKLETEGVIEALKVIFCSNF